MKRGTRETSDHTCHRTGLRNHSKTIHIVQIRCFNLQVEDLRKISAEISACCRNRSARADPHVSHHVTCRALLPGLLWRLFVSYLMTPEDLDHVHITMAVFENFKQTFQSFRTLQKSRVNVRTRERVRAFMVPLLYQ